MSEGLVELISRPLRMDDSSDQKPLANPVEAASYIKQLESDCQAFQRIAKENADTARKAIAQRDELLATLEFAVALFTCMPLFSGTAPVEHMQAAIAKVRGE